MQTLKSTLQSIARHSWLSFATVLVLSLLVVIFDLALMLDTFATNTISQVNQKVDLIFDIKTTVDPFDLDNFLTRLRARPETIDISVVYSDEATELFGTLHPDLVESLERFDVENPFPTSVSVITRSPEDHTPLQQFLETQSSIVDLASIHGESSDENIANELSTSAAHELERLVSAIGSLFSWMSAVFFLSALAIVINSVYLSLFVRQDEILIMRLVGATHSSIRRPYLLEGLLLALGSVLLGNFIFGFIAYFASWQSALYSLPLTSFVLQQLLIAGLTGLLASYLATERYLRRQTIRL